MSITLPQNRGLTKLCILSLLLQKPHKGWKVGEIFNEIKSSQGITQQIGVNRHVEQLRKMGFIMRQENSFVYSVPEKKDLVEYVTEIRKKIVEPNMKNGKVYPFFYDRIVDILPYEQRKRYLLKDSKFQERLLGRVLDTVSAGVIGGKFFCDIDIITLKSLLKSRIPKIKHKAEAIMEFYKNIEG